MTVESYNSLTWQGNDSGGFLIRSLRVSHEFKKVESKAPVLTVVPALPCQGVQARRCGGFAVRVLLPIKSCQRCGKNFKPKKATNQFCSRECYRAFVFQPEPSRGRLIQLICAECKTILSIPYKERDHRFCSLKCFYKNQRRDLDSTVAERFWSQVNKTDTCWLWTGGLTEQGYGFFRFFQNQMPAHRVSWILTNGEIPNGLWALHKCDGFYPKDDITYRRCVRPDHLYLGMPSDNSADCSVTERHRIAKLTWDQVELIRKTFIPKYGEYARVAREYGVDAEVIRRIVNGITFASPKMLERREALHSTLAEQEMSRVEQGIG